MAVLMGATKTTNMSVIAKKIDVTHKSIIKAIKDLNTIKFESYGDNWIIDDIKSHLISAEDILSDANKSLKKFR